MNVLLFGATGMVGRGVLRECLLDPDVRAVQSVGRTLTGIQDGKLHELVLSDLSHYGLSDDQPFPFDACFFCLGVSSSGMTELEYSRITYDLTMAIATTLAHRSPNMTFIYVSGDGTDSTEHGRSMWARVKGRTENALLRLPFRAAYMFRPGFIQPLHGARSKTAMYRWVYTLSAPLVPLFRFLLPNHVLNTVQVGRAMLLVAKHGAPKRILASGDIRTASFISPSSSRTLAEDL